MTRSGAFVAASAGETVRGVVPDWSRNIFWPAPFTGRTLINDHMRRWTGREVELMQNVGEGVEGICRSQSRRQFRHRRGVCRRVGRADP